MTAAPLSTYSILLYLGLILVPLLYGASTYRKDRVPEKWRKEYQTLLLFVPHIFPSTRKDAKETIFLIGKTAVVILLIRIIRVATPLVLRNIVDTLSAPGGHFPWTEVILFISLEHIFSGVLNQFHYRFARTLERDVSDRLNCAVYDKLMSLSIDYHDTHGSAISWNTVVNGGHSFAGFSGMLLFDTVPSVIDLILAISAFWGICGGPMATAVTAFLVFNLFISSKCDSSIKPAIDAFLKLRNQRDSLGSDAIQNWLTVRSFNRIKYEQRRFREAMDSTAKQDFVLRVYSRRRFKSAVMALGLTAVSLMIAYEIHFGDRSVGDFVMLLQYWGGLTHPIQRMMSWYDRIEDFNKEADRLLDILRREPTIKDKEDASDYEFKGGKIAFENVTFSYDGKRRVIEDVSFEVKAGQTIAIVGETGGGKSTLLKLLCRNYEVSAGSIKVDDQEVRDIRLESLLQHISVVPQTIGVFNASILENLKYARLDATDEECEATCQAAALHKKVKSFAKGYEEVVGPKGVKLSGGELQRLAIARVLLRNSKIVLFDEATNSLDSETESRIQEHLRKWCIGRTVIMVAHRLSTITHADLILAVKDGRIVEAGGQADLLAKKGYFFELWDKQRLA